MAGFRPGIFGAWVAGVFLACGSGGANSERRMNPFDPTTQDIDFSVPPYKPVPKQAGCPIERFKVAPADIKDHRRYWFFSRMTQTCPETESEDACLRHLQDRACLLGADLLFLVNPIYPEEDHTQRWEADSAAYRR